ncbi:MAG TPA: DNA gyrase inhibitor YacG [Phycisphaerae bacterium]|nr:DNA gyrase inhibitor YacG [Phycisphaerae bacterium]HOJ75604.1 DNA gyrase inhibitor YacG [Phycisphaerae bacterium]HOM50258.1 DNA gyrase inhibitor YacG [Phycisphaerae bacterium]HON66479.1 DNA gyrase inhibitor YacG [Phycisphaerae bacterium]HOQ85980.1 DNA gyrase inhibitor YacG [Phycisphaerae bacterium]
MPTYECPICRTKLEVASPEEAPYRPFCSRRCKLVDLGRWLSEEYRISEEIPETSEDESKSGEEPPAGE